MVAVAGNQGSKKQYVDNGWPETDGEPAVSELRTDRAGALSPFGDIVFPVPSEDLPYLHPVTVVNR
ncbi:hypothetical protein KV112_11830 [Mycolicibacter sp. MYC123]|uniref:Uncharacterized protein n=1 Tax=[Mycobacterium] zoologicum TaxID=2872311 RepID=A0ABU5YK53_9MYCO|nr:MULTISPECIES: hypothetical protein [unclassified Mycolicibacter]MEB3050417.1 hypothetical protein [Mycolicibacter sp. MYC123]MEB3064427.1 hypothetical protein [Mycolicibacter sp. MYC101]